MQQSFLGKGTPVRLFFRSGLALILAGAMVPTVSATGFKRSTYSAEGLGVANALGADAEHVSSMAYNPAALAFQEGAHLQAGLMRSYLKVESSGGGVSRPDQKLYVDDLYATYRDPAWSFGTGLAINRPFRIDSKWDFEQTGAATRTELNLVDVNPTVSYRLRPGLALAVGADYYRALDFEYSEVGTVRKGDGDGWGGTVGLMFWRESWSVAATYRSGADLEMTGQNLDGSTFHLPSRARIGFKFRPSLGWSIHLDAVRTGWNEYEGLEGVDPGKDWESTVGYKAGAILRLSDRSDIRFGYSYEPDPKNQATFDPRSNSGNRHMLTVGTGWEGDNFTFDLAYGYAISPTQDLDGAPVDAYNGRNRTNAQYLMFSLGYSNF
ncbi:OmpP1/FadL family transporter [Thiohalorhabdus sp. Cl-TMA]|uniref:OmpP1/FadL family transporter n=1 Tax=Thiohalorhabdus methylotrophus TaxID=3242694 RepID=A0ABV4U0Z1_9GAMM